MDRQQMDRTTANTRRAALALALLVALTLPAPPADATPRRTRGKPSATLRVDNKRPPRPHTRLGRVVRRLIHRPRALDAKQAAALIRPGDKVFVPVGQVTANVVLKALAERARSGKPRWDQLSSKNPVQILGLSNVASRNVFDRSGKIVPRALFLGPNARDPVAAGRGSFVPVYFSRIPRLMREGKIPLDVALLQVSRPDALGYVSLGPTVGTTPAALEKAKLVVAQVNDQVPRTRGASRIHVSRLDYVVEHNEPLVDVPSAKITGTDRQIARNVVDLVLKLTGGRHDGGLKGVIKRLHGKQRRPTFQFGIGGIPDAVANQLATSSRLTSCSVRSELIGPGTRKLVESGKVKGKVQYTFAMGDQGFLKWMHNNRKLQARPVEELNSPSRIGDIDNMVAINSAVRVDLNGQVNAQYVKDMWYSGVGGQVDFMRGAMKSRGGKAIIALPSTAMVSDGKGGTKMISKIVPHLGAKDVITTNMHDLQYVVTEHGVAALEGKGAVQRARALISIAHPRFRPRLTRALEAQLQQRRKAERKRFDAYHAQIRGH
jgi:4-hydroxybutyrate CoA-transferase